MRALTNGHGSEAVALAPFPCWTVTNGHGSEAVALAPFPCWAVTNGVTNGHGKRMHANSQGSKNLVSNLASRALF